MALSNYSDLKTAVKNWLNNSEIDAYIPDFITLAEERLNRELRIEDMVTTLSSTISGGVVTVPSDFLEFSYAYIDGSPAQPLGIVSADEILRKYPTRTSDSKPMFIAKDGGSFIFGPYPDANYTLKGSYYKKITSLSDSSLTNWYTNNAIDVLLFAALLEAEPFIREDERLIIWESKYQNGIREIKKTEKRKRLSGPLRSKAL